MVMQFSKVISKYDRWYLKAMGLGDITQGETAEERRELGASLGIGPC